ncbi:MAG: hypothetical protein GY793_08400 [Proteobacteria bacterium]|nr:hypothetical protein [Pseudomonadota bacterium]
MYEEHNEFNSTEAQTDYDVNETESSAVDNDVEEETSEFETEEDLELAEQDLEDPEEEGEDESEEESSTSSEDENTLNDQTIPYTRFKEVNEQMKEYKQKAEEAENLKSFVNDLGIDASLSKEDLSDAVGIIKQLQTNPAQALESLKPIIADLEAKSGLVLSPELQQAVDQGEITEEYAYKLSQANASSENLAAQHAKNYQDSMQRQNEQMISEHKASLDAVISSWKQSKEGDPDYKKMEVFLADKVGPALTSFSQQNNRLPSSQEMVTILDKAHGDCRSALKSFLPKKRASKVVNQESSDSTDGLSWRDRVKRGQV